MLLQLYENLYSSHTCNNSKFFYSLGFAEEASHKEGIKTGAETIVNGAALIGFVGAMSGQKSNTGNERHPKTWHELGDMQRAKPGVTEFGKQNCSWAQVAQNLQQQSMDADYF